MTPKIFTAPPGALLDHAPYSGYRKGAAVRKRQLKRFCAQKSMRKFLPPYLCKTGAL
jgi:hypothetical protein